MALTFAPARRQPINVMTRRQAQNAVRIPANDCPAPVADLDAVLRAALTHLTQHGLDAPRAAHREALAALREGDREAFTRWTAICRTFDRRAANALDRLDAKAAAQDNAKAG